MKQYVILVGIFAAVFVLMFAVNSYFGPFDGITGAVVAEPKEDTSKAFFNQMALETCIGNCISKRNDNCEDVCLMRIALQSKDTIYCENITDDAFRENCFSSLG